MNRRFFLGAAAALPFVKVPPVEDFAPITLSEASLNEAMVKFMFSQPMSLGYAITRKAIDDNLRRALFSGHTDPIALLSTEDGDA